MRPKLVVNKGLLIEVCSVFLNAFLLSFYFVPITGREEEWDAEELDLAAEALGYGAVKYESNLCFSFHVEICLCIVKWI